MGFSSLDDAINALTNGQGMTYEFAKNGSAMQGAGTYHSLWTAGGIPGAGAAAHASTPGQALDNFPGSFNWPNSPNGTSKHIFSIEAALTQNCGLMIYDRLVGVGGITLSGTGNKTVNSAALTRYTGGGDAKGNEVWLEVYSANTSVGVVTATLNSYTNQAGVSGRVATQPLTFPAAATVVGSMVGPFPLLAPDKGVEAVSTINLSVASTAAALANLLIIRKLLFIPCLANMPNARNFLLDLLTLPRVYDTASLGIALLANNTTAVNVNGILGGAYN